MPRPRPTRLFHFTHVDHLASIARDGLVCDAQAHHDGRLQTEVGNVGVKEQRRKRVVRVGPGGVVADYVPFYFAPRNLMMYQIHTGQVPTYRGGQEPLVYLCTTLEQLISLGLPWVASNRNATKAIAAFTDDPKALDHHVDWDLASTSTFNATPEDPDRPSRHQAELLVHSRVPWEAVMFVGVRDARVLTQVQAVLRTLGGHRPKSDVRVDWYF